MTADNFDFAGFFTIVLTEYIENRQQIVRQIFEDCWSLYIANAHILIPTEDYEMILLYTYFPFTPEQCEGAEPVIYDFFRNNTFILNSILFPDKFANFYKCPLIIATYDLAPFVKLDQRPDGSYNISGIEGVSFLFRKNKI